jgi:HK97 family phage portal protein
LAFWSNWFKKKETFNSYQAMMTGGVPVYVTDFGENIYASDVVQQAIYSIVTELKKLDPVHVRIKGNDLTMVSGKIQQVLEAPNEHMTTSDFIEKIAWNLLLNYNAFVYPIWNGNTLEGLYPLQPRNVEFDTDYAGTGKTWVRFTFANGYQGDVPYQDIIHLRYRYSVNELMGGNRNGEPDYQPLLDTLKLNDNLLKGLAKSLNIQTTVTGIVKLKQMHNTAEQIKLVKEFEDKIRANESGFLPLDISADYMPLTKQVQLVDATTLEFIDKKILRTFGVSIPIVNGDYTKEQYEAFYQKTLEPIVKSFGQAFTKALFTRHETQGFNNKIMFFTKELIFMNTSQKLELAARLGERGSCYENEYRSWFGLRPIPELEGVRMMSLNYVDTKDAKQYQTGEKEEKKPDDNKPEEGEVKEDE